MPGWGAMTLSQGVPGNGWMGREWTTFLRTGTLGSQITPTGARIA